MADVTLQAVLTAKDEASAKISKFSNGLNGVITKLAGVAAIGIAAGTAVAGVFVKQSIDAAKAQEVAMARVDAILKTLRGSFDINKSAVMAASKAALQLGFDDEDAAQSMAKLQQVTQDSTLANKYLSAAMDLARFKGIDLETATSALTIAMQGNGRILKQLGIDVPDNASKQEILGLVMQRVGGQAEAFGNTYAGAQMKAKVALDNLKEDVGTLFLPIMTQVFTTIAGFLTSDRLAGWLQDLQKFFTQLRDLIKNDIVPLFDKELKNTFTTLGNLTQNFGSSVGGLSGQFSALDIAVSPLIGLFLAMNKVIQAGAGFMEGMRQTANFLAIQLQRVVDTLQTIAKTWADIIGTPGKVGAKITDFFQSMVPKASGGYVSGGSAYVVGESGPELFVPSQSGTIVPNNRMGGGGISVNFNNAVVRSESDLDRIISEVRRTLNREQVLAGLRV